MGGQKLGVPFKSSEGENVISLASANYLNNSKVKQGKFTIQILKNSRPVTYFVNSHTKPRYFELCPVTYSKPKKQIPSPSAGSGRGRTRGRSGGCWWRGPVGGWDGMNKIFGENC